MGQIVEVIVKPNGGVDVVESVPSKGVLRRLDRDERDRSAFEARVADLRNLAEQGALGHSRTVRRPLKIRR